MPELKAFAAALLASGALLTAAAFAQGSGRFLFGNCRGWESLASICTGHERGARAQTGAGVVEEPGICGSSSPGDPTSYHSTTHSSGRHRAAMSKSGPTSWPLRFSMRW
jgi:hypothetical protein